MDRRVALDELRVFVTVCRLGSFSKAGVVLGIAQPTVSRIIGDLEGHVGGPMFYRTGRGVALTDLGDMAMPRAVSLLREAERMTEDLQSLTGSPAGLVVLGMLPSTITPLIADLQEHLRTCYPRIRLRVLEGFSDQIERWISEGHVDIGLVTRYRQADPGRDEPLLQADLVLARSTDAPPMPDQVRFDAAASLPLVLAALPNGLRVMVEEVARARRLPLNVILETNSLGVQRDLVRRGRCYTIIAPEAVEEDRRTGRLTVSAIVDPVLPRHITLTASHERPLGRASRAVMEVIRGLARQSLGATPDEVPP